MERNCVIDIHDKTVDKLSLPIHYDFRKHDEQESNTQFPWIYKIRSSVIYTEEFDPERRIRNAYCKSVKQETGTLLFHPYKKPYSSCIFKRFIREDPYDTQRATIKYCREKPLKFIIFGKPGLNLDTLGSELANYWKCIYINPDVVVKNELIKFGKKVQSKIRSGSFFEVKETWELIKDQIISPDSKRQGYVLSGLPIGYHKNAEFDVIEQMEFIFQTESRPDIIIYVTCPTTDVTMLNEQIFVEDLNSGYYFNTTHLKGGEKLLQSGSNDKSKGKEMNYNNYLIKEFEKYYSKETTGMMIKTNKLPQYSKENLDIYIKRILPLIDSYVLEYDSQCVIKVDGRIPVIKMLDIIIEKLSILPFFPVCQAKPLFEQKTEEKLDIEFLDDRSEDSIDEEKDQFYEEDMDSEDIEEKSKEGMEEEEEVEEAKDAEIVEEEEEEREEGTEKIKQRKNSAEVFNKMETNAALIRLKDLKPIHPNFKWRESDFSIYCPVEFERANKCRGLAEYTCSYLGKLYMMSSLKAMGDFLYDPVQYIIPPKPFPTLKIFVLGPPCSGKTETVNLLSEFFQLKIISIKELIEDIMKKPFHEIEIEVFMRKIIQVKKLELLEEEKFNEYEEQRAQDIINWITDQLPVILNRVKYASLILLPQSDEMKPTQVENETRNEVQEESEINQDESAADIGPSREIFILPNVPDLLETIKNLSKADDLKNILSAKPYKVDFPEKSGMKPIFVNPSDDYTTFLGKNISFEAVDAELMLLRDEFQTRGLDFFSDTNECHNVLNDPTNLLQYIPNELCKPYYEIPIIDCHDQRIRTNNIEDVGIRTAYGFVSLNMEELGDAFQNKILDIEAEMNMERKTDDLRIGGWIADDVPLHKVFWSTLAERFLLPDDIIIQKVTEENYKIITNNFCNIVNFQNEKDNDKKGSQIENRLEKSHQGSNTSLDSLNDREINKFLEVKNSFLKINDHYETALQPTLHKKVKKVCSEASGKLSDDHFDVKEIIREGFKDEPTDVDVFTWPPSETLKRLRKNREMQTQNPFNANEHYIQPIYHDFWDDDLFLTNYFEKITKHKIIPVVEKSSEANDETLSEKNVSDTQASIDESLKSFESDRKKSELPKRKKRKKRKDDEESVSTTSTDEEEEDLEKRKFKLDSLHKDKTRLSLLKKTKSFAKRSKIIEILAQRNKSPLELNELIITNERKCLGKIYDLFEVFHQNINSSMEKSTQKLELKYVTEIKSLIEENADMKIIGRAMQKYSRKLQQKLIKQSDDNTIIRIASVDVGPIDKKITPKKGSKLLDIFSENQLRPPARRTTSRTELNLGKMESDSLIHLQRNLEETQISAMSLPEIKQRSKYKNEADNLKNLFDSTQTKFNENEAKYLKKSITEGEEMVKQTKRKQGKGLNNSKIEEISDEASINTISSEYGVDIICHRKSDVEFHKSSSVLLHVDVLPEDSEIALPTQRKSKKCHLPQLVQSDLELKKEHSCYCNDTNSRAEYCTCKSSESEIKLAKQKKRLCIWHESSSTVFPWTPTSEKERQQEKLYREKLETIRIKKLREKLKLPTISSSETESLQKLALEKERDILPPVAPQESPISVVYATSSNDIIKWRKNNEDWDLLSHEKSTENFDIDKTSSTTLINRDDFDSRTLLPNITSIDWERFINFVNSIYLNVSTLKEVGYKSISSSLGSFYLECCPSGSDSILAGYQPSVATQRDSSISQDLFTKDEIKAIAKEFVTKLYGNTPDEYYDHESMTSFDEGEEEDLCVLEVNLPITESKFSISLNTALTCLTQGKTICQLFSAEKHDLSGRRRLSSHELNIMEQDDTVKEIELKNIIPSSDIISEKVSLSDTSLMGDVKSGIIELFEGNLTRYRSLDERFRDIRAYEIEGEDEIDEHEELDSNIHMQLFLRTVPKAILYIPTVVQEQIKITNRTHIKPDHLRRYYSLQTQCQLICDDSEDNLLSFRYILREPKITKGKKVYKKFNSDALTVNDETDNVNDKEPKQEDSQNVKENEAEKTEPKTNKTQMEITQYTDEHKSVNEEEEIDEQKENDKNSDKEDGGSKKSQEADISDSTEDKQMKSEENKMVGRKNIQFSYPFDILKLIFEKYEIINLELPDYDDDDELNAALNDIIIPKSFERFLRALDYNVIEWLNEWNVFHNELIKNIPSNLISTEFQPYYCNLKELKNDIVVNFLHNYELTAHVKKEELIKTIDLEKDDLETEDVKGSDEDLEKKILDRDIGDTDIQEILPDKFSDIHPYCPVIFNDRNELVPVSDIFTAEFRDEFYNFSSEEAIKNFLKRPEKYIPLKNAEFASLPLRICVVTPGDLNAVQLGRNIADFFGLPFMTLSNEIKRVKDSWVDLPVGIFDEDQENIKLFSLEEQKKQNDLLENEQWDHFRNYFDLLAPLTDHEIDGIIQPLWKPHLGFTFYSFPYSFNDLEYMTKNEMIPDVIVFVDVEKQRQKEKELFEQRIKTRQLLNFGSRLKKILAADHLRYECWKDVYPRLFNIVLRKFLKDRRAQRNFRERLKLIKPTIQTPEESIISEAEEGEDSQTWDVEWLLYQVNNDAHEKAVSQGLAARKVEKYLNVMDDPSIKPEVKEQFYDGLQSKPVILEPDIVESTDVSPSIKLESTSSDSRKDKVSSSMEVSMLTNFPDLKILLDQTAKENIQEEEEEESKSSGSSNKDLNEQRQVAVTDFFEPTFPKRYLPKFTPAIYKSQRSFDEDDYKNNVTNASSTSSLGLDEIDSIQSREITSSLSLMNIDTFNRQERLFHLIFGKQPPIKGHLNDIIATFKELYPTPKTNTRNLKRVSLSHSTDKLNEYYQREKENITKMQDFCDKRNIAYVTHRSTSSLNNLLQDIKNLIRKPNALDKVYIINYKLAIELIQNGLYFLSRFGYWCPVQIYEKENPVIGHYNGKVKQNNIIPVIHKSYIYFIHGRNSVIKFNEAPLKYIKQDNVFSIFPVKVAIIGSHKSRKSSTAINLAKDHGLELISLEKVLDHITENLYWTDLSKNISNTIKKGGILPTTYLVECIDAFKNSSPKALTYGWVLDGFPLTIDDLHKMKECDVVPQVIFSIESNEEYTKSTFEDLNDDRIKIQNDVYQNNDYIDMINDEEQDVYYKKPRSNPTEIKDFDKNMIDFEINSMLSPVLIIEKRMVDWLHSVTTYDKLLDEAQSIWGNIHRIKWKNDRNELLESINEILISYLWALQDYNLNLMKGLPASVHLLGITEAEYQLHKSPFKECCPGCWYYNRIYFRCPTCQFKDMKPGLIQYENFIYWLCLQHYDTFLNDPLKFLMSYKTIYGKQYPEKANLGDQFIKENLDVMCDGLCITCYYKNLPNTVHNKGYSQHAVIIEKRKIYLFCSDKCVCEMLMNPNRFLNIEIDYTNTDKLPSLEKITPHLPPKGLLEKLVTEAVYDCTRKFLFLRPKIHGLPHKTSACTYLALNLKIKAKLITDNERNYFRRLLEYFETHCRENETVCKNINQIIAFIGPLSMLEYSRKKSIPTLIQGKLLQHLLPVRSYGTYRKTKREISNKNKLH